jgi:hypothetical protein
MSEQSWSEAFTDQEVTYVAYINDEVVIIEHVPARVNTETGERLFAPQTVERIHEIIRLRQQPKKVIGAPVYEFAA